MFSNLSSFGKWLLFFFLVLMFWAVTDKAIQLYLPDSYNPFKPLSVDDKVTFFTTQKINNLKDNEGECFSVLQNSGLAFQQLPDQQTGESCGLIGTAVLHQSDISYGGGITLKCAAMVGLAMWEKHALKPLAAEHLQQEVVRINHYGTYACRNINNNKKGRRSQHAYANAIDIAGFVLEDGSEISVLKDWNNNTQNSRFLAAIHQSACQFFSTVLGPNYNQAHNNHFHFDQGPSEVCR